MPRTVFSGLAGRGPALQESGHQVPLIADADLSDPSISCSDIPASGIADPSVRDPEQELVDYAAACEHDPQSWAAFAWDWGEGVLAGKQVRQWQRDVNDMIGAHLKDPGTRYHPLQIAIASGHGIGKSAQMGMLANWAMSCFSNCKIVVTANTGDQLTTKTCPEITKWFKSSITAHWFDYSTMSIKARDKKERDNWRIDFNTWSEHNTEAFAGLHNEGNIILLLMDEASNIADVIWEVAEGALTDERTIIIWIAFGNPTRNTGRFRECFRRYRAYWKTRQIDSRTVEGTNKAFLQQMIEKYGEDSDTAKVRVRGMFPSSSSNQFIATDIVDRARQVHLRAAQYAFAPKIIGVDPSWTGEDEFVIYFRQGLYSKLLATYEKNDNDVIMAQHILRFEQELEADAVFIDAGSGTGLYSLGQTWDRNWRLVWFAEKSSDPGCLNKRMEIWKRGRQWLMDGGSIDPDDEVLYQDLIGPELKPRDDGKLQLEGKQDMKKRGIPSPNRADALFLTFAQPVVAKITHPVANSAETDDSDYNPYAQV